MRNWKGALWQDIDMALCVFCGLVCGILSYRYIIHILGVIAFTAGLVPVFGKRLYDREHPPAKAVRVMMVIFRILLALLLAVGSVHFWISFNNSYHA